MMIGNFREKLLSWGAKLLLGLIIISFALWGIGDYTTNTGGDGQIVAEIGEQEISSRELESQIQGLETVDKYQKDKDSNE